MKHREASFPTLVYRAIYKECREITSFGDIVKSQAYTENACVRSYLKLYDPYLRLYRLFVSCIESSSETQQTRFMQYFYALTRTFPGIKFSPEAKSFFNKETQKYKTTTGALERCLKYNYLVSESSSLQQNISQHLKSLPYPNFTELKLGRKWIEAKVTIPSEVIELPPTEEEKAHSVAQFTQLTDLITETKSDAYHLASGFSDEALLAQESCHDIMEIHFLCLWKLMCLTYKPHVRNLIAEYIKTQNDKMNKQEKKGKTNDRVRSISSKLQVPNGEYVLDESDKDVATYVTLSDSDRVSKLREQILVELKTLQVHPEVVFLGDSDIDSGDEETTVKEEVKSDTEKVEVETDIEKPSKRPKPDTKTPEPVVPTTPKEQTSRIPKAAETSTGKIHKSTSSTASTVSGPSSSSESTVAKVVPEAPKFPEVPTETEASTGIEKLPTPAASTSSESSASSGKSSEETMQAQRERNLEVLSTISTSEEYRKQDAKFREWVSDNLTQLLSDATVAMKVAQLLK